MYINLECNVSAVSANATLKTAGILQITKIQAFLHRKFNIQITEEEY
jgi:hypothetical protein